MCLDEVGYCGSLIFNVCLRSPLDLDYFVNDQQYQIVEKSLVREVGEALPNCSEVFQVSRAYPKIAVTIPLTQHFKIPIPIRRQTMVKSLNSYDLD